MTTRISAVKRHMIVPALHPRFQWTLMMIAVGAIPLNLVRDGAPATFLDAIAEPVDTVPITHAVDCVVEASLTRNHSNFWMPRHRLLCARTITTS